MTNMTACRRCVGRCRAAHRAVVGRQASVRRRQRFATADGRARFVRRRIGRRPRGRGSMAAHSQYGTRARPVAHHDADRRLPRLMAHQREPVLDIHPADAARLGLVEGDLARVESPHGASMLPIRLSGDQRRGEVFASMHWTDQFTSAGPIGRRRRRDGSDLRSARTEGDAGASHSGHGAMVRAPAARIRQVPQGLITGRGCRSSADTPSR